MVRFLRALTPAISLLLGVLRWICRRISPLAIWFFLPFKVWAYRTRSQVLKRVLLEVTTLVDFLMVFADVQNEALAIHHRIYRGNFVFGKSVMVVDHATAFADVQRPTLRGNRFMGVDIVSNDSAAFLTNAGPITTGPPTRGLIRGHIDTQIMTPRVHSLTVDSITSGAVLILREWQADPAMTSLWSIRGVVTRLFLWILCGVTVSKPLADDVTAEYTRRFGELSVFGGYLPVMLGLLGTREGIRRDAYIPLRRLGLDGLAVDMTLFAAMFSLGTLVMRCVEAAARHGVDYRQLDRGKRFAFVIEVQRLAPTVTSVHRIVEEPEEVEVFGRRLQLAPGDEVTYPFVCVNRDATRFQEPEAFRLDRSHEEMAAVLSWSAGPHVCPARDLSLIATVALLDALSECADLRQIPIYNLEF